MSFLGWIVQPISLAFFIIFVIVFMFLLILLIKTPAITFLKSFLTGNMVGAFFRRDRKIHFKTVNFKAGTAVSDKKYGLYNVSEDSVFGEIRSGASIVTCHTDIGMGLSPMLAEATMKLEAMGIKNAAHADFVEENSLYYCPDCDKDIIADIDPILDGKEVIGYQNARCPVHGADNQHKLIKTTFKINIDDDVKSTMTWTQIKNYMKSQINPTFLRIMVERDVDDERQDLKSLIGGQMKFVGLGLTIFLACLGVLILYMYMGNAAPVDVIGQCKALMAAAGCAG